MRKLRVLLVVDDELVPPVKHEGDYTGEDWKAEYDVQTTLRDLGHTVQAVGVVRNVEVIQKAYQAWKPHIAFNMLEDVYGVIPYDQNMVAFFELLGLAYTGCNPLGLQLCRDKALTKKLLTYHRIRTPKFMVCRRGRKVRRPASLPFPVIVKSLIEDASAGISRRSVVDNDKGLVERVAFVHEQVGTDAIVEQFIDGRELYVGVLGNRRLAVFPPWELILENLPEDAPLIATRHVKWNRAYQKKIGVLTRLAEDLPDAVEARIEKLSRRVFRILNLCGYARLDFRLAGDGRLYLLEANPNPDIAYGEDLSEAAHVAGLSYPDLIQRILNLGLRWYEEHQII